MIPARELPELWNLLAPAYFDGWDEDFLDPEERLDYMFAGQSPNFAAAAVEVRRVLSENGTDEALFEQAYHCLGMEIDPFHQTWREWFTDVLTRLESDNPVRTELEEDDDSREPVPLPRVSRWYSEDVANDAATAVLQAHENEFLAYSNGDGRMRLNLYADLDRPLGDVLKRRANYPAASAAVLVVAKSPAGEVFILAAYPEITYDMAWRQRYPEVAHFLGGTFHQDWRDEGASPYGSELEWHENASAEVRERAHAQLSALLTEVPDDAELLAAVDALGCYVQPRTLRPWLERVRDRIRRALDRPDVAPARTRPGQVPRMPPATGA